MRMTHRLTALLLALLMLMTALPVSVLAEEEEMFSEGFGEAPVAPVAPTLEPTETPTAEPTVEPTAEPTPAPTVELTAEPTAKPTAAPTAKPTAEPVPDPTAAPIIEKAVFQAGLARISGGVRLYEYNGLWGVYVETTTGGIVYASEQSEDEKAIRITLNNGVSLWEGWVASDAVRMLTEEETAAYDLEEREENTFRTCRGHELLAIPTINSEPTATPAPTEVPAEDFSVSMPMMTPEVSVTAAPSSEPAADSTAAPSVSDDDEDEEMFSEEVPVETAAPLEPPVFEQEEVAEIGKFVEHRALSAPTALSASHNRLGLMTLRWQGTEDADAYQVLYKTQNEESYAVLALVYGTSYTTDQLDPTMVYYFRVQGVTLAANGTVLNASPHSASYPYIVLGDAKINDPRGKDTTTIRLTWTAVEGATHYDVIMSLHGANDWKVIRTDLVTDYCDIKDLSFDETYDFRVIPKRELDNGTVITGNSSRVIMVGSPMETPSFQQYDWTEDGLLLTWDAIPGASGYVIYRRAFSEPDVTNYQKLVVLDKPITTFLDTTMVPGEVYYYFVYSFKLCSPEGWRCFSLKGDIGMGVWLPEPTGMVATDYDAKNVLLTWPAVTGASHYDIYATKNAATRPSANSGSRISLPQAYHNTAVLDTTYYYYFRPVRIFSNGDISVGPWSAPLMHTHENPDDITYRALLIGNTYPNEDNFLPGCDYDARSMAAMLGRMPGTPYSCSVQTNLSDSRMINAIRTTFAEADANDVSLFYFSGHGANSPETAFHGALVGTLHTYLSLARLKEELDMIPGKKVVIIDSCHSGYMIGKSAGEAVTSAELSAFNSQVIDIFSSSPDVVVRTVDGEELTGGESVPTENGEEAFSEQPILMARGENDLANAGYYVITAAHSTEDSVSMGYDYYHNGKPVGYFGLFTYGVCHGSGWNIANYNENTQQLYGASTSLNADRDGNGEITLYEAYVYAKAMALRSNPGQTAQIWPANSAFVVWSK